MPQRNAGPYDPAFKRYPTFKGLFLGYAEDEIGNCSSTVKGVVDGDIAIDGVTGTTVL